MKEKHISSSLEIPPYRSLSRNDAAIIIKTSLLQVNPPQNCQHAMDMCHSSDGLKDSTSDPSVK